MVAPEDDPALVLLALPAEQYLPHRCRQVVVADLVERDAPENGERMEVPLEEGLLGLRGERPVHGLARAAETQGEQEAL